MLHSLETTPVAAAGASPAAEPDRSRCRARRRAGGAGVGGGRRSRSSSDTNSRRHILKRNLQAALDRGDGLSHRQRRMRRAARAALPGSYAHGDFRQRWLPAAARARAGSGGTWLRRRAPRRGRAARRGGAPADGANTVPPGLGLERRRAPLLRLTRLSGGRPAARVPPRRHRRNRLHEATPRLS